MHEPILAWMAFLGATIVTWVYRRYFEHEIAPDEPFERWCEGRPMLAAIRCGDDAGMAAVERALRPLLEGVWVNVHGGRPWPQYKLRLGLIRRGSVLLLCVQGTRRLKVSEAPRSLLGMLATVLREADCEVWVRPEAVHELPSAAEVPSGWTLAGEGDSMSPIPLRKEPLWLEGSLNLERVG